MFRSQWQVEHLGGREVGHWLVPQGIVLEGNRVDYKSVLTPVPAE
jgi:hypothetical protein